MLLARSLARFAPRATARLSRTPASPIPNYSALLHGKRGRALQPQVLAFSTSRVLRRAAPPVGGELSEKLESEIQLEAELKTQPQPVSIADFLEHSEFKIQDTPGLQDVKLTRKYKNEKITVTFSISDIPNIEDEAFDDDTGLNEEEGSRYQENDGNEDAEAENETDVTCRLNIVIEKHGKGALNIEAVAQNASISVENMYYYQDPAMAHSASPDAVHRGRDVYPGPSFGTLDEDLQLLMEGYLDERAINSTLAVFVSDYSSMKEQREYLAWLRNVKAFVDA